MAKQPKMQDQKNYMKRIRSSHTGTYTGSEMTDTSKMLSIEYDLKMGAHVSEEKLEEYRKWKEKKDQN